MGLKDKIKSPYLSKVDPEIQDNNELEDIVTGNYDSYGISITEKIAQRKSENKEDTENRFEKAYDAAEEFIEESEDSSFMDEL